MTEPSASGYYMVRPLGDNPQLTMPQPIYYFAEGPRAGHFHILAVTDQVMAQWIPWKRLVEVGIYDAWAPVIIEDWAWRPLNG